MKPEKLSKGDQIVHPSIGSTVTVERVTALKTKAKVYFRAKGTHGWFGCALDKEVERCEPLNRSRSA